ncbi:MAG: stage III sporulation protein AE [Clostridia bacterium]|nr:stage III sporulation protein AE [Clostridia bacterium]
MIKNVFYKKHIKIILFVFIITLFSIFILQNNTAVGLNNSTYDLENSYEDMLNDSNAKELFDDLPQNTKNHLSNIGISEFDWQNMLNISHDKVFLEIFNSAQENFLNNFSFFFQILAVIILCAVVSCMNVSLDKQQLNDIINLVGILCLCVIVINPIVLCIENMTQAVKISANFMLAYIPVMAGIMLAMGQTFSSVAYNFTMATVSEIISQTAANVLIPALNIFLSFSIISGLSKRLNLSSICDMIMKLTKWLLATLMTVFTAILAAQNIISASADNASYKAIRLALGSFVPVIGSALGEAYATIQASVKILKSGVGIFAIVATGFIFIPPMLECIIWMITVYLCKAICDLLSMQMMSVLLDSVKNVLSVMISIMICCMAVFIVSGFFILNTGGMI